MLFGFFTLLVALVISAVAEFYSIVGLTAIFSAAFWPVVIMGASLGVGKITAAVWLKLNWNRASWTYKAYLIPAVAMLMFLTSMGIFGFLSKAHSDQSLVSGDVQAKIAIYDERIKTAKENIEANRKQLKQMDEAVDQVMARSTSEAGADKSNAIRKSQQRDRAALAKEIEANQKLIASLNQESAPIRAEVRKVESEVGPVKYIAALIYGDNADSNLLEAAVRWVIILIVAVFDPLALVLILAAQQSIRWNREDRIQQEEKAIETDVSGPPPAEEEELLEIFKDQPTNTVPEPSILEQHPYLNQPFAHFTNIKPIVGNTVSDDQAAMNIVAEPEGVTTRPFTEEEIVALDNAPKILAAGVDVVDRPGDYLTSEPEWTGPMKEVVEEFIDPNTRIKTLVHKMVPDLSAAADNATPANADFGTQFPPNPVKGDMYVRVDFLPPKLYKFNGAKWIEVDKAITDSHYSEEYIKHLVDKIATGEYAADDLSESEQEQIREYLSKNGN